MLNPYKSLLIIYIHIFYVNKTEYQQKIGKSNSNLYL